MVTVEEYRILGVICQSFQWARLWRQKMSIPVPWIIATQSLSITETKKNILTEEPTGRMHGFGKKPNNACLITLKPMLYLKILIHLKSCCLAIFGYIIAILYDWSYRENLIDVVFFSDLFPCTIYMLTHEMTLSPYHVLLNYNISVLGRGHT